MDNINEEDFGARLERLRVERGVRVSELARRLSVSPKSLYAWLGRGGKIPRDISQIKKLAAFFSVSVEYLLFGSEAMAHVVFTDLVPRQGIYEISIRKVR